MLVIVLLGLLALEDATAFKFRRKMNSHEIRIKNSTGQGYNEILKRQKEDINEQKELLDKEIDNINRQKAILDTRIEYINRQKQHLDEEIKKIDCKMEKYKPEYGPIYGLSKYRGYRAGNEYIIVMPLPNYKEEEITIKANNGRLVVDAVHGVPGEPKISYLLGRDLPKDVDAIGSWSYKGDVLRVVFTITKIENNNFTKYKIALSNKVSNGQENKRSNDVDGVLDNNFDKKYSGFKTRNDVPNPGDNVEATTYIPILGERTTNNIMKPEDK